MAAALSGNRGRGRGRGGRGRQPNGLPPHYGTLPAKTTAANVGGQGLNGGTPAPASTAPPMEAPPVPAPSSSRGGGRGRKPQGGGGASVGGAALPGPGGRQLAARVSSGAITAEQAQRTMQQRQTLAKALGPDWRKKLQVGGKSFADVNAGLKKNPGNAKLAALRKRLMANRSSLLEDARSKGKKKGAGSDESASSTLGE